MDELIIDDVLKNKIIDKIQKILNNVFKDCKDKQYIKKSKNYLEFACPICGDSYKDSNKKRGFLYWNDLYFHCFNCGEHLSLNAFLRHFDDSFEGAEKIKITNYINENHKISLNGGTLDFYLFDTIEKLAIPFDEFSTMFNVYRINEHTYRAYPYLKSRFLQNKLNNFGYNPKTLKLYIFNFARNGNIVGYQTRDLSGKETRYKTYTLERMYEQMHKKFDKEILTNEDDLFELNKISSIFGILNVNLSQDFTIFEGPIDSFFMHNSIGLCGVKKNVADFEKIPTARFFFDNDDAGKQEMINKLKGGGRVFMWERFCKDYNISKKKVKDLNDLIKYEYTKKTGCLGNLKNYFTNDHLDLIYV